MVEPSDAARRLVREQYTTVRQALTALDEQVLARYWGKNTPVRVGFGRFLSSIDEAADRLLGNEEPPEPKAIAPPAPEPETAAAPAPEPESARAPASEPVTAAVPDAEPGTVEVTFTLPAEVAADRVALSGEFNDWATDAILLRRDADGTWRTTISLEPGRSYRYRYLLDGERWENAWHADRYEPNAYGSVDSVVVVD